MKEIRHFRIPGTRGLPNRSHPEWFTYETACGRRMKADSTVVTWDRVTCKQCRTRKHY